MYKITDLDNYLLDNNKSNDEKNKLLMCSINYTNINTSFSPYEILLILLLNNVATITRDNINICSQIINKNLEHYHSIIMFSSLSIMYYYINSNHYL
jgi:hypothetical protein